MSVAPEKYTRFVRQGTSKSGLTDIWDVVNPFRGNLKTGEVRWHGAFRKYCFYPNDGFLFDAGCLKMIAAFLDEMNTRKRDKGDGHLS